MGKKFYRKIVKDRKNKEQYSINLPPEFVKILQLEGSMTELEIVGDTGIIRKIGKAQTNVSKLENESNTEYETF